MAETKNRDGLTLLYEEHLLLGATFASGRVPQSYGHDRSPSTSPAEDVLLCDMSSAQTLLFCGDAAPAFASTAFAGKVLRVGSCSFEAVLTGDGSVASIPLLARTGSAEYIAIDISDRAEVLSGWLSFLASIEQEGVAPFAGMDTQDVTGSHVVLCLWGSGSKRVLEDYVQDKTQLPRHGSVCECTLDNIPCIIMREDVGGHPLYAVMVPPVHAVALWRSLLSFTQVKPVGVSDLKSLLSAHASWMGALVQGDAIRLDRDELVGASLVREGQDFVGARGIMA